MKDSPRLAVKLYNRLLRLYPADYQQDFGEERLAVFSLVSADANRKSRWAGFKLLLAELHDLPGALFSEHQRAIRRKQMQNPSSHPRPAWGEILPALAVFLFPLVFFGLLLILVKDLPKWVITSTLFLLLIIPAVVLLGLLRGLPRWVMPWLGFFLYYALAVASDGWLKGLNTNFARPNFPYIAQVVGQQSRIWIQVFAAIALLVLLAALVSPLRQFYRRARQDWTLLSLIVYGAVLIDMIIAYDPSSNATPFLAVVGVVLIAGGWLYLRSSSLSGRILALLGGMTLANLLVLTGFELKLLGGGAGFSTYGSVMMRHWQYVLMVWGIQTVALLLPAVMVILPRMKAPAVETQGTAVNTSP